jgi:hypothetical protein
VRYLTNDLLHHSGARRLKSDLFPEHRRLLQHRFPPPPPPLLSPTAAAAPAAAAATTTATTTTTTTTIVGVVFTRGCRFFSRFVQVVSQ